MKKIILMMIGLMGLVQFSFGQLNGSDVPYSFNARLGEPVAYDLSVSLKNIESVTEINTTDPEEPLFEDPVIGEVFPIAINPLTHGKWTSLENGDSIWRLQINSSSGEYMMLIFNEFYLPQNTKLYVYSQDRSQVLGAFTSEQNTPQKKFTTTPIKSRSIVIEYFKPAETVEREQLGIQSIGLITKNFSTVMEKSFGSSGSCMANAMCYPGWCNERRSVALIIRVQQGGGQMRWCTGSLLTNERRDGKPFFLTAFHCLDNSPQNNSIGVAEMNEVQNWLFIFNYQSSGCANPASEPSLMYSISGATYLDSHDNSDYAILQLNQKPPKNYNSYYNGWSNDDDDMTGTGVVIHHPSTDIKKLSEWDKKISPLPNFWRVDYTAGSTEPGSSGSALFNSSGYIVGQLKMGFADCSNNLSDYYGRFDKSWHNFGLSWQLNPNGIHSGPNMFYISSMSGDETCKNSWYFPSGNDLHTSANVSFPNWASIGTRMYDGVYNAKTSIIADAVTIQSGTSVSFEAGNTVVLNPGFSAVNGSSFKAFIGDCENGCGNGKMYLADPQNNEGMVVYDGQNQNQETAGSSFASNQTTTEQRMKVYPNPSSDMLTIDFDRTSFPDFQVEVSNEIGQVVYKGSNENRIDVKTMPNGLYVLKFTSGSFVQIFKIVVNH